MISTTRLLFRTSLTLVLLALLSSKASAEPIEYTFKVGQNLVYDVTVRAEFPDHVETKQGYLMYEPKSINKGKAQTKLSYYWDIYWSKTENEHGGQGGGGGLPFFLRKQKSDLGRGSDFVVDRRGKVVSTEGMAGESQLPHALGSSYLLLMQPVPTGNQKEWSTQRDLTVERYQSGNAKRQAKELIPAKETVTYIPGETNEGILTIQRKYNLESTEKIGPDPIIRISGDGDYQFNPKVGAIENYEMKLAQDIVLPNASLKIPIHVEARLLTPEEVKKLQDVQENAEAKRKQDDADRTAKEADDMKKDAKGLPDGAARGDMVGGKGGSPFTSANDEKLPVIGLRVELMKWDNRDQIHKIEPLYDPKTPAKKQDNVTIMLSRQGYVVSGLIVNGTEYSHSIRIIFARLKNGKLDIKDTYTTPWIGQPVKEEKETKLGGKGEVVIGIWGKQGMNTDGIGLVTLEPEVAEKAP